MIINEKRLRELELTIDTVHPEKGVIPIKILGYGEMSLVFEIVGEETIAYKRFPIFDTEIQVKRHVLAFNVYQQILEEKIGIQVPPYSNTWFKTPDGKITLFCIQKKLPLRSIGHNIIHQVSEREIRLLVLKIMMEMKKVWDFNKGSENLKVGLDGQISNWSLIGFDPENPSVTNNDRLIYLDTTTPFYRKNEIEAMEAELFLKSAPVLLRGILKALFMQEIMDRYYDWRLVTIDLIANFYKEQRSELISGLIKTVNDFFSNEAKEHQIDPLTLEEVHSYYQNDKLIWEIFLKARRLDRYFKTRLLHGKYDFYLPEDIKR
ncbi:MAG: DUF6206 family protein [Candidatus Hodarchaeales archaeon]|jgi:hypothetical protein